MDKFISPCPPPTPYERELLTILIEECAEVAQRATKMLRFGVEEVQPEQPYTNAERLALEFGDLLGIAKLCEDAKLIPIDVAADQMSLKLKKLEKFMQTTSEM